MKEPAVLMVAAAVAATAIGLGLHLSGSREGRQWAFPAGVAALVGGIGYALYWPGWVTAGLFLGLLFLLHRSAKTQLERAAKGLDRVEVPRAEMVLRRVSEPGGRMAAWSGVPSRDKSVMGPGSVPKAPEAGLVLWLDFKGETEDEYSVVLESEAPRFLPGVMVCHHVSARGRARKELVEPEPISDIPGLTPDLVVRAVPTDHAFNLLDLPTLTSVAEIIALHGSSREVYITVSGPKMQVVSDRVYSKSELERLLRAAAALALRVRVVGILNESV